MMVVRSCAARQAVRQPGMGRHAGLAEARQAACLQNRLQKGGLLAQILVRKMRLVRWLRELLRIVNRRIAAWNGQ